MKTATAVTWCEHNNDHIMSLCCCVMCNASHLTQRLLCTHLLYFHPCVTYHHMKTATAVTWCEHNYTPLIRLCCCVMCNASHLTQRLLCTHLLYFHPCVKYHHMTTATAVTWCEHNNDHIMSLCCC